MNLTIKNISKEYSNGVKALNNISLSLENGMTGLLGPNGAGKSTLLRTIATLQEPDTGNVKFNEIDIYKDKNAVRRVLGYLPQEFGVYPRITAVELLNHMAILKGVNSKSVRKHLVENLLVSTNLYDHRKKYITSFSGGMKQRFGIAQALIGDPKILIVDEPTAGLDPEERNRFYNILSEIGENKIIILSTHIVEDVNELCTKVAIINKGKLLFYGTPQKAIDDVRGKIWQKEISKENLNISIEKYNVIATKLKSGRPIISVENNIIPGEGFVNKEANLEDAYFNYISSSNL